MDEPATPSRRESDPVADSAADLRVLIIDDDPQYRAFVGSVARRHGWSVSTAEDGLAALACLEQERFDLLVVDYEMPRMNGMELIARVRTADALRNLYALMLTARGDMETKIGALTAGFDDFLAKDASAEEIAAKLLATRRVLGRQQNLDVAVRRLYGLATRDELTGVYNRRFFLEEAARMLDGGVPVSLVLFDLDDFKTANDSYGHLAGDRILRDVGALFNSATRPEDLIARYGGDEFVLVATRVPLAIVERLTARLQRGIAELHWSAGPAVFRITATTGIASSSLLPSATVEQLLNAADRDLYKNKWLRKHPHVTAAAYHALPPRGDFVLESQPLSDDAPDRPSMDLPPRSSQSGRPSTRH